MFRTINHHHVVILVDTHNFVQPWVASFLTLPASSTDPLQVMVDSGGVLECLRVCPKVPLCIEGHSFGEYLFVVGLNKADIVLGVQWLKQLGPVLTDYTTLMMTFSHLGH